MDINSTLMCTRIICDPVAEQLASITLVANDPELYNTDRPWIHIYAH